MITAFDQKVLNQYGYVNFYKGTQAEILEAILRELNENPAKPRVSWISFDAVDGTNGQAHFSLPQEKAVPE